MLLIGRGKPMRISNRNILELFSRAQAPLARQVPGSSSTCAMQCRVACRVWATAVGDIPHCVLPSPSVGSRLERHSQSCANN